MMYANEVTEVGTQEYPKMNLASFKMMLGILGNYLISDRIFAAIDRDSKGLISLEDYLVYNETLSHGS